MKAWSEESGGLASGSSENSAILILRIGRSSVNVGTDTSYVYGLITIPSLRSAGSASVVGCKPLRPN